MASSSPTSRLDVEQGGGAPSIFRRKGGERYHVLGLVITDPEINMRIRNVVVSAIINILLLVIKACFELFAGEGLLNTAIGLACALFVPMIGYVGARQGSAPLMCIFCTFMMLTSAHAFALFLLLLFAILTRQEFLDPDIPSHIHIFTWNFWTFSVLAILVSWGSLAFWAAFNGTRLLNKLNEEGAIAVLDDTMDTAIEIDDVRPSTIGSVVGGGKQKTVHVILQEDEDLQTQVQTAQKRNVTPETRSPSEPQAEK